MFSLTVKTVTVIASVSVTVGVVVTTSSKA
jgi:hypothetical protein